MNTWEIDYFDDDGYYDPFEDMDDIELGDNDYYDDFEERDYIFDDEEWDDE